MQGLLLSTLGVGVVVLFQLNKGVTSDRLCAVRFSIDDGVESVMTVIGVYHHCDDHSLDCYICESPD